MSLRLSHFLAVALLLTQACSFREQTPEQSMADKPSAQKPKPTNHPESDTLTIAAVGDMMLGTSYPNAYTLPPDSAVNSFAAIEKELQSADITMGNLEGTLLDKGTPAQYKLHLKSKAYLFRMPTSYAQVLKKAGFDVLSLANNHIGDFGEKGRNSTVQTLDSAGIHYAGLLAHPTAVFKRKDVTYGFCSFAPNANTVPILDLQNARTIIDRLKKRCDIVIVSFHGGAEGMGAEHVTRKPESYFSERRGNVFAFARNAIDAGADMVFGNGPHVSRAMEVYKGRIIAYSLGNFCTYKSVSVEGVCGLAPLLKVKVNRKGEFLGGQLIALRQTHAGGLVRDTANRVITRIKYLTHTDFPEGAGLEIADNGVIKPVVMPEGKVD